MPEGWVETWQLYTSLIQQGHPWSIRTAYGYGNKCHLHWKEFKVVIIGGRERIDTLFLLPSDSCFTLEGLGATGQRADLGVSRWACMILSFSLFSSQGY